MMIFMILMKRAQLCVCLGFNCWNFGGIA